MFLLPAGFPLNAAPANGAASFVQAVEFPFEHLPKPLWERELVWLRNIGIRTVAFRVAAAPGEFSECLRLLRQLELGGWIRGPLPATLRATLTTQLRRHGGPLTLLDAPDGLDADRPPGPVTVVSAVSPDALAVSRRALESGHGTLLWVDVEDSLYPGLRRGAVSLAGEERPGADTVRRSAALINGWTGVLGSMVPRREIVRGATGGTLPAEIRAVEVSGQGADAVSALSIVNAGAVPFTESLRVYDRRRRRFLLPRVTVPPRGALWLPVDVPLAYGGLCRDCTGFARRDRVVYATVELQTIEFENGILAMEFSAPVAGEAVLELSHAPTGPYLAAGAPERIDWDAQRMLARLPIPAGKGRGNRVRVGLAIEPAEQTGFFTGPARLVLGRSNLVSTVFSSPAVAARSRLLVPAGFEAVPRRKSPNEIDYDLTPAGALHGEFFELALEADGLRLGRTRLQTFRPAALRLPGAAALHFGETELRLDPPLVALEPHAPRNFDIAIRNHTASIENYALEVSAPGFEFLPSRSEVAVGAVSERTVSPRLFARDAATGLYPGTVRLAGAAVSELPFLLVVIRRGEALAFSQDLDGDGSPEWVLENQLTRAVFSARDGGRWLEFVWKATGVNALPEPGAFPGSGPVAIRPVNRGRDAEIQVEGAGWRRVCQLSGTSAELRISQDSPLPPEALAGRRGQGIEFGVERSSERRAIYTLRAAAPSR